MEPTFVSTPPARFDPFKNCNGTRDATIEGDVQAGSPPVPPGLWALCQTGDLCVHRAATDATVLEDWSHIPSWALRFLTT